MHFYFFIFFIFSVITNIQNTVSVTPLENAKTFVNGVLISESTVLHHVSMKYSDECCLNILS